MNKLDLLKFLMEYKKEISNGNKNHIKDLIVVIVYSELSRNMSAIEKYNLTDVTLSNLKLWNLNCNILDLKEFEVPSKEELTSQINQYKIEIKENNFTSEGNDYECAFATWLKLMIDFRMITEGQIIDLTKYKLTDFITDEKLAKCFEGKTNYKVKK